VKKLVQKQNNSIRGYFKNGQGNVPKMQRIKGKVTRRVPEKIAKTIKRSVVVSAPSKNKSKKIVVQEQNNSSRRYFKSQHSNNNKVTTVKEKETRRAPEKVVKRPDIVEKINQERKSQRLSVRAVMSVNTSKR
jgi:hypothetical protein